LNLRHGIAHQDIAPRNLLVDDSIDSIKLFDFNHASRISKVPRPEGEFHDIHRNDVKGVLFTAYELITQDYSLRRVSHEKQNLDDLNTEWIKHLDTKLDYPVRVYQQLLREWREWRELRAGNPHDGHIGDAPEAIDWPPRPNPPERTKVVQDANGRSITQTMKVFSEWRWQVLEKGGKVLTWERPPQSIIDNGTRVLSNG
jgi:serine/threonine protein kinase